MMALGEITQEAYHFEKPSFKMIGGRKHFILKEHLFIMERFLKKSLSIVLFGKIQMVLCQPVITAKNYREKQVCCLINYGMPVHEEELEQQIEALSKKFLYEIYKQARSKKLNRKELAALLQISPGYLSQLFHSKKPLTFEMLIRVQQALHIEFDISARPIT
jgi:hypothetical protein